MSVRKEVSVNYVLCVLLQKIMQSDNSDFKWHFILACFWEASTVKNTIEKNFAKYSSQNNLK